MKKVEVIWEDAASVKSGWVSLEQAMAFPTLMTTTVGHLIYKDDKVVRVVTTMNEEGACCDVIVIPRGMVKKMRYLK